MEKKKGLAQASESTSSKMEYIEVHPGAGKCLIYAIQDYADMGYHVVTGFSNDGIIMGREVPTERSQSESKIPDKEKPKKEKKNNNVTLEAKVEPKDIPAISEYEEVPQEPSEEEIKREKMLERLAKARASRGKKKESNK